MTFEWTRKPAVRKAARISGYVAFGVLVFAISVVLTFPASRLRGFLETRLSRDGLTVRIQDLSMRGFGSVRLKGLKVDLPPDRGTNPDGSAYEDLRSVTLDQLDVSVGLFRLMLGDLKVKATATSGEGTLGPVIVMKTADQVTVDVESANDFPLPTDLPIFGVRFAGRLASLKGQLTYDLKGGLAASKAHFDLKAEGLRAPKPTLRASSQANVTLTDVDLGSLSMTVNLDKRSNIAAFKAERKAPGGDATVLHLEKVELDGQDVKAQIEGHSVIRVMPARPFKESQLALELAFSLSEPFFDRQVRTATEVSTPNRFLRTLLGMDPKWRSAQSGAYWGLACSGSLERPVCQPKKPSIRGGDFKVPAKTDEKAEARDAGTRPTPAASGATKPAAPAAPPPPTPAASPTPPPVQVQAPPPRQEPPPAQESGAVTSGSASGAAAPSSVARPVPMTPTVIGRARIRGLTPSEPDEPAPGSVEGNAPPTTAPAGEGEGQE